MDQLGIRTVATQITLLSSVKIIKSVCVGVRETTDQILSRLHGVTPLPSARLMLVIRSRPRRFCDLLFHIN